MNKQQLIDAVTESYGGSGVRGATAAATEAVESVLDTITRALVKGETVRVTGFGTLEPRVIPARRSRNPQTGEQMTTPAAVRVRFTNGQGLKELLDGKKELPESGSAIKKAPKGSKSAGKKAA